jgi:hypothetical protein
VVEEPWIAAGDSAGAIGANRGTVGDGAGSAARAAVVDVAGQIDTSAIAARGAARADRGANPGRADLIRAATLGALAAVGRVALRVVTEQIAAPGAVVGTARSGPLAAAQRDRDCDCECREKGEAEGVGASRLGHVTHRADLADSCAMLSIRDTSARADGSLASVPTLMAAGVMVAIRAHRHVQAARDQRAFNLIAHWPL